MRLTQTLLAASLLMLPLYRAWQNVELFPFKAYGNLHMANMACLNQRLPNYECHQSKAAKWALCIEMLLLLLLLFELALH